MAKIAISLPREEVVRIKRAVRAGRAASVSGYIGRILASDARRESIRSLLDEMVAQFGEPTAGDNAWAKRVLTRRRRE